MMRPLVRSAAGITLVGLVVGGCSPQATAFLVKCEPLAMTSKLDHNLTINLAPDEVNGFAARVETYFKKNGFTYGSERNESYLSPPDQFGRQKPFTNIQVVGCTSGSVVWAENVVTPNQFIVTVHRTAFGDRQSSDQIASDLKAMLKNLPRAATTRRPISA